MSPKNNPELSPENQPSISQAEAINLLENTIKQLTDIVDKINNQGEVNLPNQNAINNLVNVANELATSLEIQPQKPVKEAPKKFNFKLIIIGILGAIALILTTNFLLTKPSQEIAKKLPTKDIEITEQVPELTIKEEPTIVDKIPEDELEVREEPPELIPSEKPALPESIPSEKPTIEENLPILKPKLTPEQNLIASIQNQVAEISQKYAEGSILAIEANFDSGYLTVTIDDTWYQLGKNQQNKLSQEILNKAQILDFYKLTIKDNKNNLIARSPVVGNKMIILRR